MDEFAEWGEGTTGVVAADSTYADGFDLDECHEQLWQRNQRDAVVCLVDCNEGMFGVLPAGESAKTTQSGKNGTGAPTHTRGVTKPALLTTGQEAAMSNGAAGGSNAAVGSSPSFFSMTMQCILALLKEKMVCGSKDVVAIVLYNTRMSAPSTGFRGVYVMQEVTRIGTGCVQKVEQLEAAGAPGSAAYEEFEARIGHWPTASTSPALAAASSASGRAEPRAALPAASAAFPAFKFSEALWEAQRILLSLRSVQAIRHRRLFVFTNRDDPSGGDAQEWNLCRSRACDLGKEGVVLEVFGFGNAGSGGSSASPLFAVSNQRGQSLDPAAATADTTIRQSGSGQSDSPSPAPTGFVQDFFWGPLLREIQTAAAQFRASGDIDDLAALAEARGEAFVSGGEGAIYMHAGAGALQQLLGSVVRRAHPQRPFRHCLLRIGGFSGTSTALSTTAAAATARDEEEASRVAAVPRMAVSLYAPLMRARLPQREWLDGRTNRMLRRVVHLNARTTAAGQDSDDAGAGHNEGDSGSPTKPLQRLHNEKNCTSESMMRQEDVHPNDLCYYAPIGKERVYFTSEERKRIVEVAATGTEPGFTVLLFKDLVDAVKREHVVRRSSFLHSCVQRGGAHSHRVFVLFVRRLRAKQKVAIAQYCSSITTAPRLVALVPSPDLTAHPEKRDQVPVDGMGLYVVPLPYAEELRAVPELRTCTRVNKHATPVLADSSVDPAHLELAKQLVSALTVSYQVDAVFNPALQRQYRQLQELARRLFPLADNPLHSGGGTALAKAGEEGPSTDGAAKMAPQELDSALPDYEGMQSFAALFQSFNKEVLGKDYDAFRYCPQPRVAGSVTRRPRDSAAGAVEAAGPTAASAEEDGGHVPIEQLICRAAAENAWDGLIIPQLKEYLATANVSSGGARRKADLIELVKQHFPLPS
ncbi:putative KU70 protein [Leishmania major strain Friedlin]|uniref:Putative KU70 protein n=1 Tax=Leishmania major TaxID=5664 RepID=E9ADW3_LEIMA|nr:putative KU70 protein [Leishmania major strain Friedlin]CAG9577841.1 KU70_protein_-_putative [Leishmania major strain Friedlin]CBZ12442.1 putative KU70 protein [Leishmania major strain Friedlin]|eukprot:XP_003722185.1 putative KU70 protein [Leishmania major strain Friedlin]